MGGRPAKVFELPERQAFGVDGLNLVEFPLSVLGNRVTGTRKTLEFAETIKRGTESIEQTVILTGSDKYGLPTSTHHDLLIAAIQLAREKNQWKSPRFEFTIYELLEVVRWHRNGYYYELADKSLRIYKGLNCFYENAWFVDGTFRTKGFSIIDDFELYRTGEGGKGRRTAAESRKDPSYIVWGSVVFADFEAKRTKGLNYDFYRQLSSSVSKQLYRFLDKWFHYGPEFRHPDARVFGCDKIGLSRHYKPSKIVDELNKAADELARAGYLVPVSKVHRFCRAADGVYSVHLERISSRQGTSSGVRTPSEGKNTKALRASRMQPDLKSPPLKLPVIDELVNRGVWPPRARTIANGFDEKVIAEVLVDVDCKNSGARKTKTLGAKFICWAIEKHAAGEYVLGANRPDSKTHAQRPEHRIVRCPNNSKPKTK